MSAPFRLTSQAIEDLDAIWWIIAEDNWAAAERVETEIIALPSAGEASPHGN
jgi:plasmid stabilization system protein ParE